MSVPRLSQVLWRERHLLELLLFKVETEQLVLTTGRTRWLDFASREVTAVVDQIRETEQLRATITADVTGPLGLAPDADLSAIAAAVHDSWSGILIDHRDAFARLVADIGAISDSNRELLAMSNRATQETLMALKPAPSTYDPTGQFASAPSGSQLIDQTL